METRRYSIQNGTNSSRAVGREHLRQVADSHGIGIYAPKALLERPTSLPQYATSADHDEATRLLAEARRAGEKFKDPSKKLVNRFKSQAKRSSIDNAVNWDFTTDERASLLYQNIQHSGNVGLAQALLEYRGDNLLATVGRNNVATKVVKQITKGSTATSAPSFDQYDWLPIAVRNNSIQHVILLASRSQAKASLNRAFEVAISGNASAAILEELVRYGVDPNDHAEKIIPLLKSNRADLVEIFLRSVITLQPVQLNMALVQALDIKNMQIAAMLLGYGGDPNYAGARGFIDSVRCLDLPMTLLLLANPLDARKIRVEYLDHALTILASIETSFRDQRLVLLDALISAGASITSAGIEDELFNAVGSECLRVVQLLTSCGVIVDHKDARCIRKALESSNPAIFDALVMGRLTGANLTKAVPQAMKLGRCKRRFHVMQVLLGKGVKGLELSQAIVTAMDDEDGKLFAELVKTDTSADGPTVEKAFRATDPAYLDILCSKQFFNQLTASHMIPIAMHPNTYHRVRSRMVAKASRKQVEVLSKALIDEIAVHDAREEIIAILLENGASVDFGSGSALYQAVMAGRLKAVQQLTDVEPAHLSLHGAFRAAMSLADIPSRFTIMKLLLEKRHDQKIGQDDALCLEVKAAPSCGNHIVTLLLAHDASVDFQSGKAVISAVNAASVSTLQLLLNAHPSKETLVAAFTQAMTLNSTTRLNAISIIAEEAMGSATALPVGLYLERAITDNDLKLCKLLLHYGADPNVENGKAYIQAARLDDTAIFEELLVYRPNVQRLLPSLIRDLDDEVKIVACLKLCFTRLQILLNHSENVLLFLALDQFEEGESLVRFLLESGCSAGATRDLQLSDDSENESVTPLIWALSRPVPGPSRKVLLAILDKEHEAKPDFATPVTKTTAVLEAAKTGRHAVLARLVALGAKVNVKDSQERSALLLASEAGNVAIVTEILKARVRPNDGSLHAAARGAHEQIVGMLLDGGHSPNHIHVGRNALAELCLKGHADGDDWEDRAYWVVDILIKRGTNLSTTFSGKNLLHLALDNDMPTGILKVLLQFSEFSENLNSDSFLYEDANATVYSPTSYAEAFYTGPANEKAKLVKLLVDKNCARNMWNRHGRHPAGYTYNSMPTHLKEMQDQIQRRQEQARIERELADRNHKHLMDQAAARRRQESLDAQQREGQQAAADMRRHEAEKRHKREIALAEAQSLKDKHQLEINQQSALATQRQQIEDRDRVRTLLQQQQMNALELERAAAQSRFEEQQHSRQLQLLSKQDDSIRIRAQEMRSVAQAAQMANTNVGLAGPSAMPPKQIGFRDDWATVD